MNVVRSWRPWIAGFLLVTGCGPASDRPDVVPVTGTVTYQNQPVAGANVAFQSNEQGSFGITDAQGRFQLQTFEANDGARPGQYFVTISKVHITVPEFDQGHPKHVPPPPPKHLIPEKYAVAGTSGLKAKVVKGEKNDFPFDLKD